MQSELAWTGETAEVDASPSGPFKSICNQIASRADRDPGRVAVDDGSIALTYADLDNRANQLARFLQDAGTGPESCVAILMERSTQFVVCALATLKAGAAYLPLDPDIPHDRLSFILSDAGAEMILSHRRTSQEAWTSGCPVVEVDGDAQDAIRDHPGTPVSNVISADGLAYVIYTSGSTGQPKGVEITHANLSALIEWHLTTFQVTSRDRASHVAGLGFDASVWELWPSLAAGASVVVADDLTRRSPQALRDWLIHQSITLSFVPTILAEQLIRSEWPADTALRIMLTGAEALHRRPSENLPFILVNNYGPTECTVVTTSGVVKPQRDQQGSPTIGTAVPGAILYVLDNDLEAVPRGEAGELCVSGTLVGRGYRNRPDLTSEKFTYLRTSDGPPTRIYRTGDLVRLRENGEIEFVGRIDDQVKVRGHRIELGEVAACLNRIPGVDGCAVSACRSSNDRGDQDNQYDGDLHLVAYIVSRKDGDLSTLKIREEMMRWLPDYMVPSEFVSIAELPMTANGKLDRSCLPLPDTANRLPVRLSQPLTTEENASEERSVVEHRVASLIAGLLDRDHVDLDDNFFLMGGHSMLGAQLILRLRQEFGISLGLRKLFGAPTIRALAAEISALGQRVNSEASSHE